MWSRFIGGARAARLAAAPLAAAAAAPVLISAPAPPKRDSRLTFGTNCEAASEKLNLIKPPKTVGETPAFRRVLVTGGAGFLGSNLCRRLLADGHEVMCLDNYFTSQRSNISDLIGHPRFELIRHDVTEPFFAECDYIFNLACPASPPHYQFNPIKTMKVSILGSMNMLGLAKRVKARILQASTSEVYGDPSVHPQPESYWGNVNPIGIRSCYDEGKRAAETLCFDYLRSNNVDIRVIRIFNTYGPGMHPFDGRVVTNFIMQALNNEDITIYGDGSQTRSFCYVDDLIEGMLRLMDQKETVGPVNVGNPNEFTMLELAEIVLEVTGSNSKIVFKPLPGDDPKQRKPDIRLAKAVLGWEPKVQLREGIGKTVDYFKRLDLRKYKKPTPQSAHTSTDKETDLSK